MRVRAGEILKRSFASVLQGFPLPETNMPNSKAEVKDLGEVFQGKTVLTSPG
ncbi:hypothetical protein F4561_005408 [Lipingzhangella halophila]|uniref:Uncharacterized protein n=1 Tax=Lipingzhangella halophila TaxID=1783352 RepID=A0A7W7W5D1_9ACTN|nr:hypothetical protein [Lipingzhangella halophila]